MKVPFLRPILLVAATAALGACSSYGGYGYSGVSVGYGYASPYYGWYDDYYYPGTGYYIYDRYGSRHRWSDRYRRYWMARRPHGTIRDNWSGYRYERRDRRPVYRDRREYRRDDDRRWGRDKRDNRRWSRDRGDRHESRRDNRGRGDDRRGRRNRRD